MEGSVLQIYTEVLDLRARQEMINRVREETSLFVGQYFAMNQPFLVVNISETNFLMHGDALWDTWVKRGDASSELVSNDRFITLLKEACPPGTVHRKEST